MLWSAGGRTAIYCTSGGRLAPGKLPVSSAFPLIFTSACAERVDGLGKPVLEREAGLVTDKPLGKADVRARVHDIPRSGRAELGCNPCAEQGVDALDQREEAVARAAGDVH